MNKLLIILLSIYLISTSTTTYTIDWWLYKPSEIKQLLQENQQLRALVEAMAKNKNGAFEQIDYGLKKITNLEQELRCSLMVKDCIIAILVCCMSYTWYQANKTFVDGELDNAKQSIGHIIQQINKKLSRQKNR